MQIPRVYASLIKSLRGSERQPGGLSEPQPQREVLSAAKRRAVGNYNLAAAVEVSAEKMFVLSETNRALGDCSGCGEVI